MNAIPSDLLYTKTHEWIRQEDDGSFTLGITEHAQQELGDIVLVDLSDAEAELKAQSEAATLESVKAVSEVYAPFDCQVLECNSALEDNPDAVNKDPYGTGWLLKIKPIDEPDLGALQNEAEYAALCGEG